MWDAQVDVTTLTIETHLNIVCAGPPTPKCCPAGQWRKGSSKILFPFVQQLHRGPSRQLGLLLRLAISRKSSFCTSILIPSPVQSPTTL